ncbi:MAG TPA: CHRD domain-containing protein [Candidatus Limnocylindrales bacterium]|nr:CHRD domain-containing protein [Candidatus Limnocylindrales bacterium]
MKFLARFAVVLVALFLSMAAGVAQAEHIGAALTGYQEVPSVSTVASGEFRGFINRNDDSIDYELTYGGLQGTILQSHIHVAQRSVNGSIVIFLCQTATNPDPTGLAPPCPQQGTVTGRITTENVIAGSMAPQQLTAGDLAEVIRAIRAGVAYANVHTNLSPGGEIRGQIKSANKHRD